MNKKIVLLATLFIMAVCNAQDGANSKGSIYYNIFEKGSKEQQDSLTKEIIADGKVSKNETDLQLYYNLLNYRKLNTEAEAIQKRAIKIHPKGRIARSKEIDAFYKIESLKDKEKKYNAILKKFTIANFPEDGVVYDYLTAALAKEFVTIEQKDKALQYLDNLQEKFWRAQGYIPVAEELLKQGDTTAALPLVKKSIEDALFFVKGTDQSNKAKFAAVGYPGYVQIYAAVLLAKGQYEAALNTLEEARAIVPERKKEFSAGYAKALKNVDRDLEAFTEYSSLYSTGQFNYQTDVEELYVKLNKGQRTGLNDYTEKLRADLKESIKSHLSQIIIEKETPPFKLRNLNGDIVDSKSLIGKVVVLDFWATWCQPCIRSFPGMQKAVTKYANDADVVFLFIDTWERDEAYEQKVKDFIAKHNYSFNVLYDDGKTDSEVAPKFNIQGIPAKFVIDKKGKIRFFLTGSSPYPDYILLELTEMIERAKKG